MKDFAPVSVLAVVPNVLVVNTARSADKSVKDVLAHARREPGKLTHATAGNSTSIHLAGEVFASMAKLQLLHIPNKGSGPTVTDQLDTAGAGRAPEQGAGALRCDDEGTRYPPQLMNGQSLARINTEDRT